MLNGCIKNCSIVKLCNKVLIITNVCRSDFFYLHSAGSFGTNRLIRKMPFFRILNHCALAFLKLAGIFLPSAAAYVATYFVLQY